jgi:hypothetical protein
MLLMSREFREMVRKRLHRCTEYRYFILKYVAVEHLFSLLVCDSFSRTPLPVRGRHMSHGKQVVYPYGTVCLCVKSCSVDHVNNNIADPSSFHAASNFHYL